MDTIPRTTKTALELYKGGNPIIVIALESEGASQKDMYALAFLMLEKLQDGKAKTIKDVRSRFASEDILAHLDALQAKDMSGPPFSKREFESIESFVFAVLKDGYAKTILLFPESQRITLNS